MEDFPSMKEEKGFIILGSELDILFFLKFEKKQALWFTKDLK